MRQIEDEKPMLVIGSPPCTYFSLLQKLNKSNKFIMRHDERWLASFNDNFTKAIDHIKCCITLYIKQMDAGRYWLHEHPWSPKSGQNPEMEDLLRDPRVQGAYADQCQFGLTSKIRTGSDERGPEQEARRICQQLLDDRQEIEEDIST